MMKYTITVVLALWVNTTFSNVNHNFNYLTEQYKKLLAKSVKDSLFYANPDSATLLLTLFAQKAFLRDSLNDAISAQLKKIAYYNNIAKLDSAYNNLQTINKWISTKRNKFELLENWNDTNTIINIYWATYYYLISDYENATLSYQKINNQVYSNYSFRKKDYAVLRKNHLFLGKMAYLNGNYDEALSYYEAGIKYTDTVNQKYKASYRKSTIHSLIAQSHSAKKEYKESIKIFEQILSERLKKKATFKLINGIIADHHKIARNYIALNQFNKADSILKQSRKYYREDQPYLIEYLVLHASLFNKIEKYNKALSFLNEAEKNQINANQQFAYKSYSIYFEKGNVFKKQKEFDKAQKAYKQAETCLFKESIDTSIFSIASLSDVFYKKEFAELLSARANCLQNWYAETDRLFYLQQSKANIDLALETLESLRQEYASAEARQFLIENSYSVFEKAIAINNQLWELTNQPEYFEAAFQAAERSKSLSLTDALKKEVALKATGISDEDLNKEKQFQYQIYQYKKQLAEQKSDSIQLAKTKDELFKINEAYKDFNKQLETDYPLYHQLKYQTNVISVKEVQSQLLDESAALVEYFFGADNLYVFYIDQNKVKLVADSAVHQIKESGDKFIHCVAKVDSITKEDKATYVTEAFYLKDRLLKTGLIEESINRLTIIPDGQIAYIPFEVLLTKDIHPQQIPPFGQLPYLMRQFTVNYSYAASLLKLYSNTLSISDELINFLGIAPSFAKIYTTSSTRRSCNGVLLDSLENNQKEVIYIKNNQRGKVFVGSSATKQNFMKFAPKSKIVHIASHACAGNNEEDNRIYLYNDEYINMYDLYPLKLQAKMLVLSACETAVGSLKKGEGLMSLTRSFLFTGVPSLTTTLWSVDDKATSTVMQLYYKHLKKGLRKDEALRQAKLDFIEEADFQKQLFPGYWAGFVHFGDVEPIYNQQKGNHKTVGLLLLFLLAAAGIVVYKLR